MPSFFPCAGLGFLVFWLFFLPLDFVTTVKPDALHAPVASQFDPC